MIENCDPTIEAAVSFLDVIKAHDIDSIINDLKSRAVGSYDETLLEKRLEYCENNAPYLLTAINFNDAVNFAYKISAVSHGE